MRLIVGLGNPGKEYENTRHNVGFLTIDALSKKLNVELDKNKCKAIYGIYRLNNEKIILAKPQTYMNLSGESVVSLMKFYDIDIKDVIVVHDDLDLPIGKIRIRYKGSCGGQNGMRNIIDLTGTDEINRIRIGISDNRNMDAKDYVLGKFTKQEKEEIDKAIDKASDAIIYSFENDFDRVMSKFN